MPYLMLQVVTRRLPPTLTKDAFINQISPLPEHDYLYFVRPDRSLGPFAFSRAYINFIKQEDVFTFKEQFDNYTFMDKKGRSS
jgi:regulator of nonsense transcripts 3